MLRQARDYLAQREPGESENEQQKPGPADIGPQRLACGLKNRVIISTCMKSISGNPSYESHFMSTSTQERTKAFFPSAFNGLQKKPSCLQRSHAARIHKLRLKCHWQLHTVVIYFFRHGYFQGYTLNCLHFISQKR